MLAKPGPPNGTNGANRLPASAPLAAALATPPSATLTVESADEDAQGGQKHSSPEEAVAIKPTGESIIVSVRIGRTRIQFKFTEDDTELLPDMPEDRADGKPLTSQQRAILAACNRETPVNAKRIARVLGKADVSSYLREQLRRMVEMGKLRRFGGGYLAV